MKNINDENLPQLIVGLDSLDEDANYIHILDAKENIDYYCPCCKGKIKPRAYKNHKNYQVQVHFYHENGGCSEETYVHFICKEWLFEKGCKFIVNNTEYEVDTIDIEKTLHTSFGDYRPDIIVNTTCGKVFYFEIKSTNKKTELYIPKWDYLDNDVVEVDTRYFINQKFENQIPVFQLIYSDGECFIKKYKRKKYDDLITVRKAEWKRQDKLNYKIKWERLDWFWNVLCEYCDKKNGVSDVLEYFGLLDYSDKLWIYYNIKDKSCVDLKEPFKDNINKDFYDLLESYKTNYPSIKFTFEQKSASVFELGLKYYFDYMNYKPFIKEIIDIQYSKGKILSLDNKLAIDEQIDNILEKAKKYDDKLIEINNLKNEFDYIKEIKPISHHGTRYNQLSSVLFRIIFFDYLHNKHIKEFIGKKLCRIDEITNESIASYYEVLKEEKISEMKEEILSECLKKDTKYLQVIEKIKEIYSKHPEIELYIYDDFSGLALSYNDRTELRYEVSYDCVFGEFESEILTAFQRKLDQLTKKIRRNEIIEKYINIVNQCENKSWELTRVKNRNTLQLKFINNGYALYIRDLSLSYDMDKFEDRLKKRIYNAMKKIIKAGIVAEDTTWRILEEK